MANKLLRRRIPELNQCSVTRIFEAEDGTSRRYALHQVVLAKVVLLPCPVDPKKLSRPHLVDYAMYKNPPPNYVYVSPRRFLRRAVIVPRFVGKGLDHAPTAYLYELRK